MRSFGVRQLAAAFAQASLLAGILSFRLPDGHPLVPLRGKGRVANSREQARGEESGSLLPHSKTSQACHYGSRIPVMGRLVGAGTTWRVGRLAGRSWMRRGHDEELGRGWGPAVHCGMAILAMHGHGQDARGTHAGKRPCATSKRNGPPEGGPIRKTIKQQSSEVKVSTDLDNARTIHGAVNQSEGAVVVAGVRISAPHAVEDV